MPRCAFFSHAKVRNGAFGSMKQQSSGKPEVSSRELYLSFPKLERALGLPGLQPSGEKGTNISQELWHWAVIQPSQAGVPCRELTASLWELRAGPAIPWEYTQLGETAQVFCGSGTTSDVLCGTDALTIMAEAMNIFFILVEKKILQISENWK